jgi:hypothetical protein
MDPVLVIDDGSSDATAEEARRAGGTVYRMARNSGKGQAMLAGAGMVEGDVAFFDADLVGLRPEHVRRMVEAFEMGYDQVCAMRDHEAVHNLMEMMLECSVTGERIVRRWLLEAVPESCFRNFNIEVALNYACQQAGGRTLCLINPGVSHTHKNLKRGALAGRWQNAKMFGRMWRSRRMLQATGGAACEG